MRVTVIARGNMNYRCTSLLNHDLLRDKQSEGKLNCGSEIQKV